VTFDLLDNGKLLNTGWVAQGEGLLMLDNNNLGSLESGAQLFGEGTTLANGQKAVNGYQALSELDTNLAGVINAPDTQFGNLKVWVDTGNSNGTATGVIESLAQLGITQLNLNAQTSSQVNNGNLVGLVSSFNTASGSTRTMADVWFATQQANSGTRSSVITTTPTSLASGSLSNNVSGLANAISGFNQGVSLPISTSVSLNSGASATAPTGVLSASMASTLTAMSQFNANGQILGSMSGEGIQVPITLNTNTIAVSNTSVSLALPTNKKTS